MPSEGEKPRDKPRPQDWQEGNPPPKSPGRPKKQNAERMAKEMVEAEPGIPEKLVAMRVAVGWSDSAPPKHGLAQFYLTLRKKNPKEFKAEWEELEREWRGQKRVADPVVEEPLVAANGEPVDPTEADEELRNAIVELLRRHEARAKR